MHQESSLVSEVWDQWLDFFWGDILRTFYPFRCSMFRYLKNVNALSTRGVIMNHGASEDSPRKEADVCSCLHRKWCAFQSSLLLWIHVQIQKPTKIALEMRAIFWLLKITSLVGSCQEGNGWKCLDSAESKRHFGKKMRSNHRNHLQKSSFHKVIGFFTTFYHFGQLVHQILMAFGTGHDRAQEAT